MLKNLFRAAPKWKSPKSQKRLEAVNEFQASVPADLEILTKMAEEDSEPLVRREAIKKLFDIDVLQKIARRDIEASVRDTATQQIADVLAGKCALALELSPRIARIETITAAPTLVYLIKEGQPIEIKMAAVTQLNDEMYLEDIAVHSSIAKLRQIAAEKISNPRILENLAAQVKGSDKSVYRIIKDKLDTLNQAEKSQQELAQKLNDLCAQVEHHSRAALNPLYKAKAESLLQQWQEIASHADAAIAERFETAFALCQQTIQAAEAELQRQREAQAAVNELNETVIALENGFEELVAQPDTIDLPALAALIRTQAVRWEAALEATSADATLTDRFNKAIARIKQAEALTQFVEDNRLALDAGITAVEANDADAVAKLNDIISQAPQAKGLPLPSLLKKAQLAAGKTVAQPKADQADPEKQKQLKHKLELLEKTIQEGNSKLASKKLGDIQQFMRENGLSDSAVGALVQRLEELKDWAKFAVLPKKEALQTEMEALAQKEMDPDAKADRIRALQNEWKALGVIDPATEQPMWEKFKEASDRAYEPCREFFTAQHEVREQNIQKRQEICAQLEAYLEALPEQINAKQLDELLRTARKEWQSHYPVSRQHAQTVQGRFNKLTKRLEARIQAEQTQYETAKRDLVNQASALLESSDLKAACDQAKQLQQAWKTVGPAHPKVERSLWADFRKHCDAVFAKREADFQARKTAREGAVTEADSIVAALEKLVASAAVDNESRAEVNRLANAFHALQLPREAFQARRQKIEAAKKQFEQSQRNAKQVARTEKTNQFLTGFALCAEAEKALAQGQFDQVAFEQNIGAITISEPWNSILKQRAQQVLNNSTPASADDIKAVCLDLEIFMDVPTPADSKSARLARQMEMLQKKLFLGQESERNARITESLKTLLAYSVAAEPALWADRIEPLLRKSPILPK